MREITFSQATLEAMAEEMRRDERVFVMGEDIARQGGIFGQFKGLPAEFGFDRVRDTPISETAIIGAAVGAALAGMRPVADMHFADFIGVSMDEVFNQMAKIRYMFGGQCTVPMVVRAPDGLVKSAAAQHSQSVESWFLHIPGVKVVAPSNPTDAKGLLKAAIRDDNPVIYFENKVLYGGKGLVPDGEYIVPIGKANVVKEGKDVTIISYSIAMKNALEAADELAKEGISAEVIDLRTISPYDKETILESVKKTGRLAIVHEAVKRSSES
jgi:pyruvate dehydrogenase E1 component beta subunit